LCDVMAVSTGLRTFRHTQRWADDLGCKPVVVDEEAIVIDFEGPHCDSRVAPRDYIAGLNGSLWRR